MLPPLRSFRVRLMMGAVVWIFIWSIIGGVFLSQHFKTLVSEQFVDELHGHADELMGVIEVDGAGKLSLRTPMTDPLFIGDAGYYWQITSVTGEALRSPSLRDDALLKINKGNEGLDVMAGRGPGGHAIIVSQSLSLDGMKAPLQILVGADERNLTQVLKRYNHGLELWLSIVALGLIGSSIAQVTFGFLPLNRVRKALVAIRAGQAERLPENLPSEVAPLISEMNALIEANLGIVRRARAQAGNLGHSLKTPLALLTDVGVKLEAMGDKENGPLIVEQCDRMARQINHQMAQARATASRSSPGLASVVSPSLEGIVSAVSRLYKDKELSFEAEGALDARVACDPRDLDDMLGNLIDNAAKWAKSAVSIIVSEMADTATLRIRIEDDGPGLPQEARLKVFEIGERLDEQVSGSGLGLAIVKDFADLYGGRVWIEDSSLGGAAACLELPLVQFSS